MHMITEKWLQPQELLVTILWWKQENIPDSRMYEEAESGNCKRNHILLTLFKPWRKTSLKLDSPWAIQLGESILFLKLFELSFLSLQHNSLFLLKWLNFSTKSYFSSGSHLKIFHHLLLPYGHSKSRVETWVLNSDEQMFSFKVYLLLSVHTGQDILPFWASFSSTVPTLKLTGGLNERNIFNFLSMS